ncbi:hypothetical protein RND61_03825 [Streptomyces sp. TRM76323]|uniref:Lipoprotein n=1 Tax=Streptomyces tamarix TaxID=3078565 RepID=A0ABU3QFC3_9ACTN|nr:hypothetical protein [Streptomyces tamarix]MDT9681208.1 hypothetical protein [Streptomyces tamarix]
MSSRHRMANPAVLVAVVAVTAPVACAYVWQVVCDARPWLRAGRLPGGRRRKVSGVD